MSEFDKWNELKKEINKKERLPNFHEREIWLVNIGKNIGVEQNGKGEKFVRPVLIIKKFNKEQFLGIMLASKCKDSKFLFKLKDDSCVVLSQVRTFSTKRLIRYMHKLKIFKFEEIIKRITEITLPQRGGLGLNMSIYNKIVPQTNKNVKTIWFDLITPKSVLFFAPIIREIQKKHNVLITTRGGEGYSETVELLELYNLDYKVIGNFGGGRLRDKLKASIERQLRFLEFLGHLPIEKLVCLSSVDAVRYAYGLGIPVYNFYDIPLSDYKTDFQKALPQARLTIPLSTKMFKPFVVPDEVITRFGLEKEQIVEYNFIDPLIWLKDFRFDREYVQKIYEKYHIDRKKFTIVVREEEYKACYVNKKYPFLYEALPILYKRFDVNIIIIPRYESDYLKKEFPFAYVIEEKIYLQHLLKDTDLFIGGGGTINSEACFLGTPTISTRSFISHYDKWQIDNGLMVWANSIDKLILYVREAFDCQLKPNLEILNRLDLDTGLLIKHIIQ